MAYDSWASQINGIPLSVHFYILDKSDWGDGRNLIPFTKGQVMNLLYMPFLTKKDFQHGSIMPYDFDQNFYGTADPNTSDPNQLMNPAPKVFKIYGNTNIHPKKLGTFSKFPTKHPRQHDRRHWTNESKMLQYPYHFVTVNDYINTPLLIKNEFLPKIVGKKDVDVMVYQPVTMTGGYTIYVEGYKGDSNNGANEGMLANAGLDLPTSSSEYSQFMATSKAQFIAQNEASNRNEWTNFSRGALSFATGAFQATLGGIAMGASGGTATMMGAGTMVGAGVLTAGQGLMDMIQAGVSETNRIENAHALMNDLMFAPRNVTMSSSDILLSMSRNGKKIVVNRYLPTPYYREKLGNYWHLYGYKQNKLMLPDTKSRKYWNYIKTMGAVIKGNGIDKTEVDIIKAIYDKGIRFWHQGKMHDYEKDNIEV